MTEHSKVDGISATMIKFPVIYTDFRYIDRLDTLTYLNIYIGIYMPRQKSKGFVDNSWMPFVNLLSPMETIVKQIATFGGNRWSNG